MLPIMLNQKFVTMTLLERLFSCTIDTKTDIKTLSARVNTLTKFRLRSDVAIQRPYKMCMNA